MSSTSYITGGFDPSKHPPGLSNPFFVPGSSIPPSSYITGGRISEPDSKPTRAQSLRSLKPYKPSPSSTRMLTVTPSMDTPAEHSTTSNAYGSTSATVAAVNGSASPMQQLVQAMSLDPPQSPSETSTASRSDENGSTQSRPTTADSSTNGNSSSIVTSSINTTPGQIRLRPPRPDAGQPLWTHRLSASFNAMAAQVEAASQAIALIPPHSTLESQVVARVEALEAAQARIEEAMSDLREIVERAGSKEEKEEVNEIPKEGGSEEAKEEAVDVAALKKMVEDLAAKAKLDQQRLPARLHNSIVTTNKGLIKPVVASNGKPPPLFPNTRGEFFHLTKERYEAMMKGYGIPIAGDLNAKRAAVREFIGLPE